MAEIHIENEAKGKERPLYVWSRREEGGAGVFASFVATILFYLSYRGSEIDACPFFPFFHVMSLFLSSAFDIRPFFCTFHPVIIILLSIVENENNVHAIISCAEEIY